MGTTSIHIPEWEGNTIHSCDPPPPPPQFFGLGLGHGFYNYQGQYYHAFLKTGLQSSKTSLFGGGGVSCQVPGEIVGWTICRSRLSLNALLRLTPPQNLCHSTIAGSDSSALIRLAWGGFPGRLNFNAYSWGVKRDRKENTYDGLAERGDAW